MEGQRVPATIEELAYETALAAMQRQEEEVSQLRSRTGQLLAAGSLVASFFGAAVLSRKGTAPWSAFALIAFVLSFAACIYLLAPKKGLIFALSGPDLHEELKDDSIDAAHLRVASWLQNIRTGNQDRIDRLNKVFVVASVALIAEVVFWTLALRGTI